MLSHFYQLFVCQFDRLIGDCHVKKTSILWKKKTVRRRDLRIIPSTSRKAFNRLRPGLSSPSQTCFHPVALTIRTQNRRENSIAKRIKPSRRISSTIEIRFRWLRHEFLLLSTTVVGVIWESSTKFPWQKRALLIQPWELLSCLFRQLTWLFFEAQSEPESAANQQLVFLHVPPVSCLLLAKKRSCECD